MLLTAATALLAALPVAQTSPGCTLLEDEAGVTAESCPIEGADYPLVRARTVVEGTIPAMIALLDDADACPDWQAMCTSETARAATPEGSLRDTLRQRVSGSGISRRVTLNRAVWWRTADGRAINDTVGADDREPDERGKRVLCMRSRWFVSPGEEAGMIEVVQETVSDPQPPFGLGTRVVTPRVAKTLVTTFSNLAARLRDPKYADGPALDSLPLLEDDLPDVGAEFARCQAAR